MKSSDVLKIFLTVFGSIAHAECTDEYCKGEWTKSLDSCWTDPSCIRVMNVVHGGDWNLTYPYDSFPAFQKADEKGADAVKGWWIVYLYLVRYK